MDASQQKALGAAVRDKRKSLNLTQAQLAERAGVKSARTVRDLELGGRNTQPGNREAILRALDMQPNEATANDVGVAWDPDVKATLLTVGHWLSAKDATARAEATHQIMRMIFPRANDQTSRG